MVNSISGSSNSYQSDATEELTEVQKRKIAQIKSDYEAKKITYAEEQQKIAEVKASGIKRTKSTQTQQQAQKTKTAPVTDAKSAAKTKPASVDKLKGLLKKKGNSPADSQELEDFISAQSAQSGSDQGAFVDETV
jgi:hypothetical protein